MEGTVHQSAVPFSGRQVTSNGWLQEAVVLAVRWPEEETRPLVRDIQKGLTLDVRTIGTPTVWFDRVPLLQWTHGMHDADLYVPRPATRNIEGGDLFPESSGENSATPAEDMDGDRVLIAFMHDDPTCPIALPMQFAHPKTKAEWAKSDGRIRKIVHLEVSLEWDSDGNLTIDASAPIQDDLAEKGASQPSTAGGTVTIKEASGKTIVLGDGAADFAVKGTAFQAAFTTPAMVAAVDPGTAMALVNAILVALQGMPLSTVVKVK